MDSVGSRIENLIAPNRGLRDGYSARKMVTEAPS
jgi:hypothetical protein